MAKKVKRIYAIVRFITSLAARLCFRVKLEGTENFPKEGPFLLLSNHQSYFDPVLCAMATKRELCFMARDTLFKNKYFGSLITTLNAIPLKRGESDIAAMRKILEKLGDGYGVCLYPEGTRTSTGSIAEIKPGFSLLSRRANAPAIPFVIDGMFEAWPRTRKFPKLGTKLYVKVGKPIYPDRIKELGDREFSAVLTRTLRQMQAEIRESSGKKTLNYPET